MKRYDLHKNDPSKLHFEVKSLAPYVLKNAEKASRPHRHSFYQILWFKNKGQHYVDYQVMEHPANTLVVINKQQIHNFCLEASNEGFLFHFNDSFIAKLSVNLLSRFSISIFNEIGEAFIPLNDEVSKTIETQSLEIMDELERKQENYASVVMHQFVSLLYRIERLKKEVVPYEIDSDSDFSKIVRFKQLIWLHLGEGLHVQDFSQKLGITSKRLTALSKQYTALTPANLIKALKILEAKRMLSNREVSIKEVAYSLGFDQPTYFTKFFKNEVHMTPKQFQEQLL